MKKQLTDNNKKGELTDSHNLEVLMCVWFGLSQTQGLWWAHHGLPHPSLSVSQLSSALLTLSYHPGPSSREQSLAQLQGEPVLTPRRRREVGVVMFSR